MIVFFSLLESDVERQQFVELYNQYENILLRTAGHYFPKDQATIEDVVQSSWIKIAENFHRILNIPCKERGAYLVTIVKNESISLLRKQHYDLPYDDAIGEETYYFEDDNAKGIIEMIRTMPKTYRAVLEMRFIEERSTKEIAAALNLKETTVDVRIHRGRSILIKKLKEEGYIS